MTPERSPHGQGEAQLDNAIQSPVILSLSPLHHTPTPPMTAFKIPEAPADIYYGGPHEAANSFVLGQGFEAMSFDGERKIVNREWAERCR